MQLNLTDEFKQLVSLMLKHNPMARPTIADILGHPWMRGDVPTKEEFTDHFKLLMNNAAQEEHSQLHINLGLDFRISRERKRHRDGDKIENIFNYDYLETHATFKPVFEQSPM